MESITDRYKKLFEEPANGPLTTPQNHSITVREYLGLGAMQSTRLIAGRKGLGRQCTSIVVWETPDGLDWLIGGEFILTAGYAFKNDPAMLDSLIDKIHERGCAGIAIKEQRFLEAIPPRMLERADALGIPLIILPRRMVYTEIVSAFYEALFYKSNAYLLESKKTHEELLDLVFDKMDNTGILEALGNLGRLSLFLTGPEKLIRTSFLFHDISGHPVEEDDLSVMFDGSAYSHLRLPIRFEDGQSGRLHVFSLTPFLPLIRNMLEHSTKSIQLNLSKADQDIYNELRNKQMITSIILQDRNLTEDFIRNVASNIGWDSSHPSYGIALKFYQMDGQPVPGQYIQTELNTILNSYGKKITYLLSESNGIVVIYLNNLTQNKLYEFIDLIQRKSNVRNKALTVSISVSAPFYGLSELPKVQDECIFAALINKPGKILTYESLGIIRLLHSLKDDPNVLKMYSDIMVRIETYDDQNGGVLMETLLQYFQHNLNKKETADAMHIHVETLRYRLNKIQALTGCSTASSEGLFILQMMVNLTNIIQ
ncbi:PucR family transcriptional regulator [Proteiniclasticum sp. QWL-01]|uniref:PucR family transcriptional regulator n=1 Tax=Proteiniclasticum sp. QWL-01 TaxID=3036945 RepID=UPI0024117DB9|nr:PucR family transcriptional regulator [Proteiniclasticum sp. QWL-01]WFF73441.1 PucR family transcriptional regulator ligand-binding domain-containing protein [Proteiniclasticum sp. QWL-01]